MGYEHKHHLQNQDCEVAMIKPRHPHRAGTWDWISFLVTGPIKNLESFLAAAPIELFDRRGNTLRCRAHDLDGDRGMKNYADAVQEAKNFDVTFQDLVSTTTAEDYPIVHSGSHGMKWGAK